MDLLGVLSMLVQAASGVPSISKYVALALGLVMSLSAIATSFVALWHAAVVFMGALSHVQGLGGLAPLVDGLKVNEAKISDFENSKLLPILNQFSAIPIPQAKAA